MRSDKLQYLTSIISLVCAVIVSLSVVFLPGARTFLLFEQPIIVNTDSSKDFPKNTCGDSLPPNIRETSTVRFYPVYTNYSEDVLSTIQSDFCRDAFVVLRNSQRVIQVASFTSIDRAIEFRDFLAQNVGEASIGDAVTLSFN